MRKPLLSLPMLAPMVVLLACAGVQAQTVYRIVGPDGKVTFSDRAPADASAKPTTTGAAPAANAGAGLPFELSKVAQRFPVTLYTGNDCSPCMGARNLLVSRGVPFTERTVNSNEDIEALRKLSGDTSLPFGTIGGQRMAGFSSSEWSQYLDVAGYPKQSQLPASYRSPAATPLVAVAAPAAAAPGASDAEPAAASPRAVPRPAPGSGPAPSNPAGIRF